VCGFTLRYFLPIVPPEVSPLIRGRQRPHRAVDQVA
jgi:hypothetical protein